MADSAVVSPDLGLSTVTVTLDDSGVAFPDGERLSWADAERIADSDVSCFALESAPDGDQIRKIQAFSATTNRHCSLMPTDGAPTLLLAGFPMHRIKGIDPRGDTLNKIKAARSVRRRPRYLDGLGLHRHRSRPHRRARDHD